MKRFLIFVAFLLLSLDVRDVQAKTFAVLVGVQQESNPLNYTMDDARLVERTIEKDGNNVALLVSDAAVLQNQPTYSNVLAAIKTMAMRTTPSDLFLFYFSGHGLTQDGKSFILPQDSNGIDNFLDVSAIRQNLNDPKFCAAKTKIVILDSCHSGSTKSLSRLPWQNLAPNQGLITMAGCAVNETSIESAALRHGVFTYFLVRGLAGAANPGKPISLNDLSTYVKKVIPEFANVSGSRYKQTPQFLMQESDGIAIVAQQNPQLLAELPPPAPSPLEPREPLKPGVLIYFEGKGADTVSNEIGRRITEARYPVVAGEKLEQFTRVLNTNDASVQVIKRFNSRYLLRGKVVTAENRLSRQNGNLISIQTTLNAQLIDVTGQVIAEVSSDDANGNPFTVVGTTPLATRTRALRGAGEQLMQALLPFIEELYKADKA